MSHRYLACEVVQTSAMDCGPASLASLLGGFGVRVSYGRLREACQTDVDGTSIDTLEEVANRLGLACEQVMLPVDHLLLDESAVLPAIVVTKHGVGYTHFVVAWRRHWGLIQVMDPAIGRRWMRGSQLLREVYVHTQRVPSEAFNDWVRSEDFQKVLSRRMRDLGVRDTSRTLLASAANEPDWRGFGALDAAIRLTDSLVESGGVRRGRQASDMIAALWKRALADDTAIPKSFWFVSRAGDPNTQDVQIRGAVLVRATGVRPAPENAEPLSAELSAALNEPKPRAWREVQKILGAGASWSMLSVLFAAVLIAGMSLVETVLLRSFIDLGRDLGLVEQRLVALGLIIGAGVIALLLEVRQASGLIRLGRSLEIRFRLAFASKLPKLNDRYFHSRPVSDMADRSHSVQQLRQLPKLFGAMTQTSALLVLTAVAISLFDASSAPLAMVAAGVSLILPFAFRPWLMEADMRVRTHSGALSRFYFDALQGLTTIKAHAAERIVQREQEGLLVEWLGAARKHLSVVLLLEGLQVTVGFSLAALLLVRHVDALADTGGALLLAYWALSLPELGANLTALMRQYPWQRNTLLRLLEPLAAPEDESTTPSPPTNAAEYELTSVVNEKCAAGLRFDDVSVIAAGHSILQDITLDIAPGSHIAVVGPSGAGKSSLIGLLLGWHRAALGEVLVDGNPLDAAQLDELRRHTAWVDPAVQLWNRSLVDNLRYGHHDSDADRLGRVCSQAELIDVLEKLPDGLQTTLGEGGGLLSGGQGQRVRLGRALLQSDARLVLLDEPFRGLDHGQRQALTRRVREHFARATLLLVTHDVGETREFDRVIVIDGGRIVEDDSPSALIENEASLYRRLLVAEESVQKNVWQHSCWRRVRVESGQVTEGAAIQ
ncbi:MAG: ATP-binding cassette domain-containing protein [Planctomycetota bacterium]|nr:ATP-binding cassette domain-containing protein [Planctomycetota bacterium]